MATPLHVSWQQILPTPDVPTTSVEALAQHDRVAEPARLGRAPSRARDRVPAGRQLLVGAPGPGVAEEDRPSFERVEPVAQQLIDWCHEFHPDGADDQPPRLKLVS